MAVRSGEAFFNTILKTAHRAPPRPGGAAVRRSSVENDDREVFLDMAMANARYDYVCRQDLLMSCMKKIDSDVLAAGVTLEVYDGDTLIETSEAEQRAFSKHARVVTQQLHRMLWAVGFAAMIPVRDEDKNTVPRLLSYSEYSVSFLQRREETRRYKVYDMEGEEEIKDARIYIMYPPQHHGAYLTPLDSVVYYLQILESTIVDEYYAHFHRTHPAHVLQPPNSMRTDKAEVFRQAVYSGADDETEDAKKRFNLMQRVEEETKLAVQGAAAASVDAARESAAHICSMYGVSDPRHPRMAAASHPPYLNYVALGQDTQMAGNVPVPQMHPNFGEFESAIKNKVYALMGIPPQLMTSTAERFASETSMVLRLYNATVQELQNYFSDAESDMWQQVNIRNARRTFRKRFNTKAPKIRAENAMSQSERSRAEADEGARLVRREMEVSSLLERYHVVVKFEHLPVIELADLVALHDMVVISEDELVRMAVSRFNIRPEHALLSQKQRDKERKRRLATQTSQTSALAEASLVQVGMEGGGEGTKPTPKRQAVGTAITSGSEAGKLPIKTANGSKN